MKKEITGKELLKRKSIHFTETLTIKKKNKSKKSIIKSSFRIIFGKKKKTFLKDSPKNWSFWSSERDEETENAIIKIIFV